MMAISTTDHFRYPLATDARSVLEAADSLARAYEYEYLSADHVLLGIVNAAPNGALDRLTGWGLSQQEIQSGLALQRMGGIRLDRLPPNPFLVGVLDRAMTIARERGDRVLTAEDILMALLRDVDSHAGEVLRQLLRRHRIDV